MIYLTNAFSLNMLGHVAEANVHVRHVSKAFVVEDLAECIENGAEYRIAIGHADTAALVGQDLVGAPFTFNRETVVMDDDTILYVAQYIGPRLPEGTTVLPEGATIVYYMVHLGVPGF